MGFLDFFRKPKPVAAPAPESQERPYAAPPPRPVVPLPAEPGVIDLRGLEMVRNRIKGTAYSVSDRDRTNVGSSEYLLVREPKNRADQYAIKVLDKRRRKVGYVSAARAASLSPLLDQLGTTFLTTGAGVQGNSVRLWVDTPKVDALRKFVKSRTK